jgi:hypothetical protein
MLDRRQHMLCLGLCLVATVAKERERDGLTALSMEGIR